VAPSPLVAAIELSVEHVACGPRGSSTACVRDAGQVEIRMDRANVASAGVPAKLGDRLDGAEAHARLARGHTGRRLIWSMTRDRWPAALDQS
jgi:hypothetical protein